MSETEIIETNVLIIGSGPAGYTAAIYAARGNLNPVMVAGYEPGGQLMITTEVENYPGFADPIQGPELMEAMRTQAENVGTKIIYDFIDDIDFSARPYIAKDQSGRTYKAQTVIISTGAKARWLGLDSEQKFMGLGVSACATCDGFFFKGKEVCVIGGGNAAVEEALFLANLCSKVTLIHRRDTLRAEKVLQDRLLNHDKINCIWDHVVDEVVGVGHGEDGTPGMTGVRLKNVNTGEDQILNCDGMFVAIGHDPATALFKGKLDMDQTGYLLVEPGTPKTKIPGVYAAGDVTDKIYRQAVTAAGMGCMAALEAERFIGDLD